MAVKVRQNADKILQFRRVGVKMKDKAYLGSIYDYVKELQLRILNFWIKKIHEKYVLYKRRGIERKMVFDDGEHNHIQDRKQNVFDNEEHNYLHDLLKVGPEMDFAGHKC